RGRRPRRRARSRASRVGRRGRRDRRRCERFGAMCRDRPGARVNVVLALLWKDLVLESRSRETLPALFVLGLLVLVVFQFALALEPEESARLGAGISWVAVVFAGVLALGRTFLIERENAC